MNTHIMLNYTLVIGSVLLLLLIPMIWNRFQNRRGYFLMGFALIYSVFLVGSFTAINRTLGHPKPVWLTGTTPVELVDRATVLGFYVVKDVGIYVLLNWDGLEYPQYFAYPYTKESAQNLQELKRQQENEGGDIEIIRPFEKSLEWRRREDGGQSHDHMLPKTAPNTDEMIQLPENDA